MGTISDAEWARMTQPVKVKGKCERCGEVRLLDPDFGLCRRCTRYNAGRVVL